MPIATRTASQWPLSMTLSMAFRMLNMLLTATVVTTKPSQTKSGGNDAVPDVGLIRAEMRQQAGQHPGHDQLGDEGEHDRAARRPESPWLRPPAP